MSSTSRSYPVNGKLIKELRSQRGWTQAELARRAGYTVRVIGKAEAGNSLDLDTIGAIAQTLSQVDGSVTAKQLMLDIKSIAAEFIAALDQYGADLVSHIEHYLAPDFVWICPGDPAVAPFIGQWHGADGLKQFFTIYCSIFRRLPAGRGDVCCRGRTPLSCAISNRRIWVISCVDQSVSICTSSSVDGLIVRIDDDYDTQGGADAKRQAEEALAKRSQSA